MKNRPLIFLSLILTFFISSLALANSPRTVYVYEKLECSLSLNGENLPMVRRHIKAQDGTKTYRFERNGYIIDMQQSVKSDHLKFKIKAYEIIKNMGEQVLNFVGSTETFLSFDPDLAGTQSPLFAQPEPASLTYTLGSVNGILVTANCTAPAPY